MNICGCKIGGEKADCPVHGGEGAFDRWFAKLTEIAAKDDFHELCQDDWRTFWEDGYSPPAAWDEDQSYD